MDPRVKPAGDGGNNELLGLYSCERTWRDALYRRHQRSGAPHIPTSRRIRTRFTKKYDVTRLVYFEAHDSVLSAIQREKNIKHWPREWKIDLIVHDNPQWRDLYDEITR